MKGPIRIGCLTLSVKYPRHDEGMQDPAKKDLEFLESMYETRRAWNDADRKTLDAIADARNALDRVKGAGPDLDLSFCASCQRSLRECLELSGCDVGKKIRAFAEEAQRNGSYIVVDSTGATDSVVKIRASSMYGGHASDRSDDDGPAPCNRHERRKRDAENRRMKKPGRRRW